MRSRQSVGRCCCGQGPVINPCPCLSGTLDPTKSIFASGIVVRTGIADPNREYSSLTLGGYISYCGYNQSIIEAGGVGTTNLHAYLFFTRDDIVTDRGGSYVLPTGVKAVIRIDITQSLGGGGTDTGVAVYYKLISSDAEAYVDCALDLDGFTFIYLFNLFPGFPVITSAAAGVVRYGT